MSVIVRELTKIYGNQHAVDALSFEAHKGQILGFLGPNGAGKTTTMKIISCFIPKTTGEATVCGLDTEKNSMEVRRLIGYLPEHNPIYKDMYVKEYLLFVAGLHKIKNKNERVAEMIERTGLTREQHKLIGALSKGYRQRVGLAQAMIHDPEVLILDEPTSGLDPNQLVDIRQLIKDLGKEKTVLFSSHIMQEVQALCDRVVIINKGKLVANDTIETLQSKVKGETIVTAEFDKPVPENVLKKLPNVKRSEYKGGNRYHFYAETKTDIRPDVFKMAVNNGLVLLELHQEVFTIEDIFQILTK